MRPPGLPPTMAGTSLGTVWSTNPLTGLLRGFSGVLRKSLAQAEELFQVVLEVLVLNVTPFRVLGRFHFHPAIA